jgi:hydroxymethylpyrimidine pyrophosphatase-like HAD family hydrolase
VGSLHGSPGGGAAASPSFAAIACDYDGTLATHDRIGPDVVAALQTVHDHGVRLILVTGRTFFELTRVCEHLDLFDVVVAENGGVLFVPGEQAIRDLAPPPPPRLLAELDRRAIVYQVGRTIVDTFRRDEAGIRDAMATAQVRLTPAPNRAALMLLAPGVSKGSGVQHAIRRLGLSFHDVLGIGDAENDLDLFEVCGWSACPGNALPDVQARVDWVLPGTSGEAVARALTTSLLDGRLPPPATGRREIELGWARQSREPVAIAAHGVNILVNGDSMSGKSWLVGGLVERLVERRYGVCVVDPEGDYHVLTAIPTVTPVEVQDTADWERVVELFRRDPSACVIADLSFARDADKAPLIMAGLRTLRALRRQRRLPHWIFLDEAHYWLGAGVPADDLVLDDKGFCLATYRASALPPSVRKRIDLFVFARTTEPSETRFVRESLPGAFETGDDLCATFGGLGLGEFVLVPADAGCAGAVSFQAAPRRTEHVRHRRKYTDIAVVPDHNFLFRAPDGRLLARAATLAEFARAIEALDEAVVRDHAIRRDFSRWLFDVFQERRLGRQVRQIEQRGGRGDVRHVRQALIRLLSAWLPARA